MASNSSTVLVVEEGHERDGDDGCCPKRKAKNTLALLTMVSRLLCW